MRLLLSGLCLMASCSVFAQDARDSGLALRGAAHSLLVQAMEVRIVDWQRARLAGLSAPTQPLSSMTPAVLNFYEQRRYQPLWNEPARLSQLIAALEALAQDGLDPEDYALMSLRQMQELMQQGLRPPLEQQVNWELVASNAYLRALYHLYHGKVNSAGLDPQWDFELDELAPVELARLMTEGIDSRPISEIFALAPPAHPTYVSLKAGLARYRVLAERGGWPALPVGATLKPCMVDPQIPLLRQRLQVTGEYLAPEAVEQHAAVERCLAANAQASSAAAARAAQASSSSALAVDIDIDAPALALQDSATSASESSLASSAQLATASSVAPINADEVFDEYLVAAVKQFQRDQYLEADGAIGPATRAALNVSVQTRVDQIRVNLDRARWLLHNIPQDLLLVDVAGFKITYYKGGAPVWNSRVQVGTAYRSTPIFKSEVNYVTLNPTWTVPPTILRKDILPKLRQDLSYLREHNIRVLDSNGKELDPASIDWRHPGNVTLRQDAGSDAALGKVVIRFPNPYAVYLHDTPHQKLFNKSQRAFSSGCIRVERARELVELLLAETPGWHQAALDKALALGKTRNVTLAQRVPIMLAYWTVDAVSATHIAFKPDIYARDAVVLAALEGRVSQPMLTQVGQ